MPSCRTMSCCLATCSTFWVRCRRPITAERRHRSYSIRRSRWSGRRGRSLRDERFKYLPTSLLYFFYRGGSTGHIHADLNGCAAGNTVEEAIVQGFLELVERDLTPSGGTIDLNGRKWISANSTISTSAICAFSFPKLDAGLGCSTSPAILGFLSFAAMSHFY